MAIKDLTTTQINALAETRLTKSGLYVIPLAERVYYYKLINALYNLDLASAGDLQVRIDDDSGGTTVRVMPGRFELDGVALSYAGGTHDLSTHNNDVAYIWAYNNSDSAGIGFGADNEGWPTVPHIKLAEVTLASGAIASGGIVDRRFETFLRREVEELPTYTLTIDTQGDTGNDSTIVIALVDAQGNAISEVDYLRVRVCDDGEFDNATNATIAAGSNTTAVETHTANKDITFQSHTDGTFEIDLTNASAETVTLRIGPAPLSARRADYTPTLDVTHASA